MDNSQKPYIRIYTDGACSPNPGFGGWGSVQIDSQQQEKEFSGGEVDTTSNRMELTAALNALKSLERSCRIDLYTDSEYLQKGMTVWIFAWIKRNWRKVENIALWQEIHELASSHEIEWHKVPAHAGDKYNERAHQLANVAMQRVRADYLRRHKGES